MGSDARRDECGDVAGFRGGGEGRRPEPPERKRATSWKRYSAATKLELLRDFEASGQGLVRYCRLRGLNTKSFCAWRKAYAEQGEAGLSPKPNRGNTGGRTGRVVPPEERREILEAYLALKLPRAVFCAQYGIAVGTLSNWLKAYEAEGPKGLEPKRRGRKSGPGKPLLPQPVRETVVATKRSHPSFGLRKVRDYVKRFFGMRVSAGGVASTLKREGVESAPRPRKRRRGKEQVRRFERALPGQLWQSDITSFRLARHSQRVYLVVFLDDHSRYVVSWGLSTRASGAWVGEVLLAGIAAFGKPEEVLTDQGPQYFAWRGKSDFQKLLLREGIQHVVARSHHPQTVGKCERLWQTVQHEFWERAKPQELFAGGKTKRDLCGGLKRDPLGSGFGTGFQGGGAPCGRCPAPRERRRLLNRRGAKPRRRPPRGAAHFGRGCGAALPPHESAFLARASRRLFLRR